MVKVFFDPFPVLHTGRLVLRQLTVDDADDLFLMRSQDSAMQYIEREKMKDRQEAVALIETIQDLYEKSENICWGMCLKGEKNIFGNIGYWRLKKENLRGEIGYMMLPSYWGKGLMDEAIKAAIDFGFDQMNFHSIEADVNPLNTSSIKLLEKNNFVKEGHIKENVYFREKFFDTGVYSLLKRNRKRI